MYILKISTAPRTSGITVTGKWFYEKHTEIEVINPDNR